MQNLHIWSEISKKTEKLRNNDSLCSIINLLKNLFFDKESNIHVFIPNEFLMVGSIRIWVYLCIRGCHKFPERLVRARSSSISQSRPVYMCHLIMFSKTSRQRRIRKNLFSGFQDKTWLNSKSLYYLTVWVILFSESNFSMRFWKEEIF